MTAALHYMPVGIANCIGFTNCILTVILARIFLGEKFHYYDILSLLSAFLGVLIINNVFGNSESTNSSDEK